MNIFLRVNRVNYLKKVKPINHYVAQLSRLNKKKFEETAPYANKDSDISSRQCNVSQVDATMANLLELHFELLPHQPFPRYD